VVTAGATTFETALGVYALHTGLGLPALDELDEALAAFVGGLNDRPLREMATLLRGSTALAAQAYQRWREQAGKQAAARLQCFDKALQQLVGEPRQDLPFSIGPIGRSPLEDILVLRTIMSTATGGTNA
jgi:hypothetical protein